MNRSYHHRLYSLLIAASMLLLSLFVGYWLYKSYDEQRDLLRREASHLFGSAVRNQQDSLLRLNILQQLDENLPADSSRRNEALQVFRFERDVPRMLMNRTDSMRMQRDTSGIRQLELFLRTNRPPDRNTNMAPNDPDHVRVTLRGLRGNNPFSIQFGEDSTQVSRLRDAFTANMEEAGLSLPFRIIDRDEAQSMEEEGTVAGLLVIRYQRDGKYFYPYPFLAYFEHLTPFLIRQLLPQIAFSLLLLLLTGTAFILIYRSWRKQQRLAVLKNDFISNITHELKTPITTVSVALEAMSNFNALGNPEKTDEYLDISKNELSRLSILVDKVLKMSIFESRELQLSPEPIDLKALCQEIIQTLGVQVEKQHARIDLAAQGTNFQVNADRIHLTNVIYNLIDNALKYSERHPHVQLTLKEVPKGISLAIRDHGIGIPESFQGKVFDKFFRVPTGDQHDRKGHGLGLSYVAKVINKHGGQIDLKSRPGEGSTFTITLNRTSTDE